MLSTLYFSYKPPMMLYYFISCPLLLKNLNLKKPRLKNLCSLAHIIHTHKFLVLFCGSMIFTRIIHSSKKKKIEEQHPDTSWLFFAGWCISLNLKEKREFKRTRDSTVIYWKHDDEQQPQLIRLYFHSNHIWPLTCMPYSWVFFSRMNDCVGIVFYWIFIIT